MSDSSSIIILKPKTPYFAPITGGLRLGTDIVVEGYIPTFWPHRFHVNLVVGHNLRDKQAREADLALHFNPRFDGGYMVLNSRIGGRWMAQQRDQLPVVKGNDFELIITVEQDFYRIMANGQHFANFTHQVDVREVGLLWLDGKVELQHVVFLHPEDN